MRVRANGDGTIFKRKDGRYSAQAYVTLTDGTRKRVCFTKRSRDEVKAKLAEILAQEQQKIPFAEQRRTVSDYNDYWMKYTVARDMRPLTVKDYETISRLYIKPQLGKLKLDELSVRDVQTAIDRLYAKGASSRTLQKFKRTLSSMLQTAMREELVFRNVARLVKTPQYKRKPIITFTPEQVGRFWDLTKNHRWYPAFLLLFNYGLRIGEALGLRWTDIDFTNGEFYIRQQLQEIDGKATACDVKTEEGNRKLSLTPLIEEALLAKAAALGIDPYNCFEPEAGMNTKNLVITGESGGPANSHYFRKTFYKLLREAGLPRITPHKARHTAATIMKSLDVPVRDAQSVLGHASAVTTQQIYQHGDEEIQRNAVASVADKIISDYNASAHNRERCCQSLLSKLKNPAVETGFSVVAPPRLELGTQGSSDHTGPLFQPLHNYTIPGSEQGCGGAECILRTVLRLFSDETIKHIQTQAIKRTLGRVAVNYCCQNEAEATEDYSAALVKICRELTNEAGKPFPLIKRRSGIKVCCSDDVVINKKGSSN